MAHLTMPEREVADAPQVGLRDWFAGQALAGILANAQYPPQGAGEPVNQFVARITDRAYLIAEAMVKQGQRLKQETNAAWQARS